MTTVGIVSCNAMLNVSVTQYLFVYVATYMFRYFACSTRPAYPHPREWVIKGKGVAHTRRNARARCPRV